MWKSPKIPVVPCQTCRVDREIKKWHSMRNCANSPVMIGGTTLGKCAGTISNLHLHSKIAGIKCGNCANTALMMENFMGQIRWCQVKPAQSTVKAKLAGIKYTIAQTRQTRQQ
jgi:hypothetical protein